jgi:tRNA(Arg) A34 adenosine deaminase TadA
MSKEQLSGLSFSPFVNRPQALSIPVSEQITVLMDECFIEAEMALQEGGTPVGAVLLDMETGDHWQAHSTDKTTGNVTHHAETLCYQEAAPILRDKLGKCALLSTLELCNMCSTTFAQGDIGTIIAAAPRASLITEDGRLILRKRKYGMFDMIGDSASHTNAYMGYREAESVELWRKWDRIRRTRR